MAKINLTQHFCCACLCVSMFIVEKNILICNLSQEKKKCFHPNRHWCLFDGFKWLHERKCIYYVCPSLWLLTTEMPMTNKYYFEPKGDQNRTEQNETKTQPLTDKNAKPSYVNICLVHQMKLHVFDVRTVCIDKQCRFLVIFGRHWNQHARVDTNTHAFCRNTLQCVFAHREIQLSFGNVHCSMVFNCISLF